ncbi:MAG TPA: hypothetical protein VFJ59_07820 [Pseudolabrys sp.]|nr:hypothetical protein [Pseudolabrys sp.]
MPNTLLSFMFKDDGTVPNNPALPVLVYKGAVVADSKRDPATAIEKLFATNGWGHGHWRDGIYPFVHYHSMIHETLGIARGRARVQLGGHRGEMFEFAAGDVVVLPAGTGHQKLSGSDDFLVIGAYPPDGTYNLCRGDNPAERDKALTTIPKVPLPESDPVLGKDGPLPQMWRR